MMKIIVFFFKELYPRVLRNWVFFVTVFVFFTLIIMWIWNPQGIVDNFFGKPQKTQAEILSYIGLTCGAILLLGNQYTANRRNLIMEKGNLDTRFKDAALLLADEPTGANISGIYALHRIAVEASKGNKNEQGYVKIIHDILCAFVRENWKKTQDGNKVGNKPTIVLQTIMDVLFKNKNDIYKEYDSDFLNCIFQEIDLDKATLTDVSFYEAKFTRVDFGEAILKGEINFSNATLTDVRFNKATLTGVSFDEATLTDVRFDEATLTGVMWFNKATLTDVRFNKATLTGVSFDEATLTDVRFYKATLTDVSFYEAKFTRVDFEEAILKGEINFSGTKLDGIPKEEIILPGRSLELTT
ncbi:MAG: pentapeptide repeat-containing protein [Candidatus Azobacteroides sp.]|nr:pentapeptide repeat-containing protein [Candidatus Azobacteroides sp.]